MFMRRPTIPDSEPRVLDVERAEAALMEHYARLVRLVYVTLPRSLGRHRRVLAAHGLVQRALPRRRVVVPGQRPVAGRPEGATDGYRALRVRVLRAARDQEARPGRFPGTGSRWPARPALPAVWGLRVFPQSGGAEELALDRALAETAWPVRAAVALLVLDGLSPDGAARVLRETGVGEPGEAVAAARRLAATQGSRTPAAGGPAGAAPAETEPPPPAADAGGPAPVLLAPEFDPCLLRARPTDLLRRRQRVRSAVTAVLLAVCVGGVAVSLPDAAGDRAADGRPRQTARATAAELLRRTPADVWADTSRVDFTAWPARGGRTADRPLLERALRAWSDPAWPGRRSTEAGAAYTGSGRAPRLLFAGDVDGRAVVVLHDDLTLVRYSEPLRGDGGPELVSSLTDGADVTTAAAVVVSRTSGSVRLLLAPWIAEAGTRDLLAPDTPSRDVPRSASGLTGPVPVPSGGGDCGTWPVVQLRSSSRIVEKHAFLLTDLGGLSPVHLTYMPPPTPGERPRPPREATGPQALLGWARTACRLDGLRGQGVRAVNHWVFAQQELPERAGQATWVCARADTWRGPGRVEYLFLGPGTGPARPAGVRKNTAECSRFGQDVLADVGWRAPSGSSYLLAAGSRSVTRVKASGPVRATADGRFLAVRAAASRGTDAEVTGRLTEGAPVRAPR
ncbi:hypothetical protein [Streptomyces apricus]|uniref:DNA-directed RNA polymerase specialized sigma24 family protein n=1 Tax=Streptomyces apricus TaxID=1828112 RepID=A0A5B0BE49_9ACTN|nr:hypothetical protein [Streptomyces apricus]KAA0940404.1 hypothetical protein FGF04_09970 [Streptomyces apricus]